MRKLPDPIGEKFSRLTVVKSAGKMYDRSAVLCVCDCGNEKVASVNQLKTGKVKSCGCLNRGKDTYRGTHRDTGSTEYMAWSAMRTRCRNPRYSDYADYGGRGISVDSRWGKYETFLADMGRKPSPLHSLDRIDVNGNYSKENCRWATPSQQSRNKRCNCGCEHCCKKGLTTT